MLRSVVQINRVGVKMTQISSTMYLIEILINGNFFTIMKIFCQYEKGTRRKLLSKHADKSFLKSTGNPMITAGSYKRLAST